MPLPASLLISNDDDQPTDDPKLEEAKRLTRDPELMRMARHTLISLPRQSVGRLAMKYVHVGHEGLKVVAMPTRARILYGPQFAVMDRCSQAYVMCRESLRLALAHIHQGALMAKRERNGFSSKAWSMASDSIINYVLENLPQADAGQAQIRHGLRRCEELGIAKWDEVCRVIRKTAKKYDIDPGPTFEKQPNELTAQLIYHSIMRVVQETADAHKQQDRRRLWDDLINAFNIVLDRTKDNPNVILKEDPVELGPIEFYDALALHVRNYNESAYPQDHEGIQPVDEADWDLIDEAVKSLIQRAIDDPAVTFTSSPRRGSISLWNDMVKILRQFADFEFDEDSEDIADTLIDEMAEELNLIDTLEHILNEMKDRPENDLVNEGSQIENAFHQHQAGLGSGDVLATVMASDGMTKTPWRRALLGMATSALISRLNVNHGRLSRRNIAQIHSQMRNGQRVSFTRQPKIDRHKKAKKAVVIIDTSGSIFSDRDRISNFLKETQTVCKDRDTKLTVIFADADVCGILPIEEAYDKIKTLVPKGGGSTDFRPAIEEAEAMKPDLIIYLTDLMGTFPKKKPSCPIIWGFPPEFDQYETPFGKRLPLAA